MSEINPQELIADLDEGLREAGTSAKLIRLYGEERTQSKVDLNIVLRGYSAHEIAGDIQQTDQMFIISPTEITNAGWPGYHNNEPDNIDLRIPRKNDQIETSRGKLTVQEAEGINVQGVLVRIQGRVRGN
jgi:hypothetical protein